MAGIMDISTLKKLFGKVIKEFRIKSDQTQEELADASELDRTYISLIERGLRSPTVVIVVTLCRGLGISTADLFKRFDEVLRAHIESERNKK
jgi:transcriptional regulator with XRE-family HTH domain